MVEKYMTYICAKEHQTMIFSHFDRNLDGKMPGRDLIPPGFAVNHHETPREPETDAGSRKTPDKERAVRPDSTIMGLVVHARACLFKPTRENLMELNTFILRHRTGLQERLERRMISKAADAKSSEQRMRLAIECFQKTMRLLNKTWYAPSWPFAGMEKRTLPVQLRALVQNAGYFLSDEERRTVDRMMREKGMTAAEAIRRLAGRND